jgi:hypothetical protein
MIDTMRARAHVNHGRWIASCPNPDCNGAEELHPWSGYQCGHTACAVTVHPETVFHCSYCRTVAAVDWPELQKRPRVENRNWFPADHEQAVKWGLPHGQTVDELRVELTERSS